MMYFVAMQLENDLAEREDLRNTLEQFGPWSNRLGDTWLVESTFSARKIRDSVKEHLSPGERVFVGEFNANWAGYGMGASFPDWMRRRATIRKIDARS